MRSKKELEERAHQLERAADDQKLNWKEKAAKLPPDDPVARIGLLASELGLSLGLAMDPGAPIEEALAARRT